MKDEISLRNLQAIAVECSHQKSGELSVYNLVNAWAHAYAFTRKDITVQNIYKLGALVEPDKNAYGFRNIPVTVGGNVITADGIKEKITRLCRYGAETLNGEDFYYEFEIVHPFIDGNGRVGFMLYNIIENTMDALKGAPMLFQKGK